MAKDTKNQHRTKRAVKKVHKPPKSAQVDFVKNPVFTSEINCEIFKALESRAHDAINNKKVFTIVGCFDILRHSLRCRGWIEKLLDVDANKYVITEKTISDSAGDYDITRIVLSHLVKSSPVYFIWQPKYFTGLQYNINHPFRNRINRMRTFDFTLKEGLHNLTENIQWHIIENVTELNYPRSYLLMDPYQREYFLHEYRRTLITSFIIYLYDNFDTIFDENGSVPSELIFNALQRVEQYVKLKQHLFIDCDKITNNLAFNEIMKQIDCVVMQGKKINFPEYYEGISFEKLKTKIKIAVAEIHFYWHDSKYDGYNNIWILKPINRSRGFGVVLMRDCEKIFDHVLRHSENKYIVQKYIGEMLVEIITLI
jgi:Tubulin-tyrosine ligase family